MTKRTEQMTVYGKVFHNGRSYFLLNDKATHVDFIWQTDDMVRWLVADVNNEEDTINIGTPEEPVWKFVYPTVDLVFGSSATVELFKNPEKKIYVSVEIEDNEAEGSPV